MCEDTQYWTYVPGFVDNSYFELVYDDMKRFVKQYDVNVYGKVYPSRRMSCTFTNVDNCNDDDNNNIKNKYNTALFSYSDIPSYDWNQSPAIVWLRQQMEDHCQTTFDYCLVHLYRDGEDKIDKHSDKEGLNTVIASLSMGATRKFRFQKIGISSGWDKEYALAGGDLLIMKVGCQSRYVHWVPKEVRVKQPRLNFTFRTYDK